MALVKAIDEDKNSESVERSEIFSILESAEWKLSFVNRLQKTWRK